MLNFLWKIIRFPVRHFLISGAIFSYWVCTSDGSELDFGLWFLGLAIYTAIFGPFGMAMKRRDIRKKEMDYFAHKLAEENARANGGYYPERKQKGRNGNSGYWLNDAMEKQENRFRNSMPPVKAEAKPQKKRFQEVWNESRGLSPTGWKFNEETQLWESPEQQKMKK